MILPGILITLVPIQEEHLPLMVKWRNDPFVSKMMFDRGTFNLSKQKEWFEKTKGDNSRRQFIVIENKSLRPIGAINLMNVDFNNYNCDWGYYIGEPEYRMGGYAIEAEYIVLKYAFEELGMHKVYCQTLSYNTKVISAHSKFGFKTDGVLRQHYKENDLFSDVIVMSILKEEFYDFSKEIEKLLRIFKR